MAFCKECWLPTERGHADWCSTQPLETQVVGLRARLKAFREMANDEAERRRAAFSTAAIWEGKFHQVKRENNALRRKLYDEKRRKPEEV